MAVTEVHRFIDPIRGVECALALAPEDGAPPGVAHPGCPFPADVSLDLDAFYCTHCRYNGRISGAWVVDLLRQRAIALRGADSTDPIGRPWRRLGGLMTMDSGYATPDRCAERVMIPDTHGSGWHQGACGSTATTYDMETGEPLCGSCNARRQGADDE